MSRVTYVLVATVPPEGVAAFAEYEATVLPLLEEYGGRLERRLRSLDGCFETHVLSFPDPAALDDYRRDPRRNAAAPLLARSGATTELHQVTDVGGVSPGGRAGRRGSGRSLPR